MNTRFSSLVTIKKSDVDKGERAVQNANKDLQNAKKALEEAYLSLKDIELPSKGSISQMLASRTLLNSQRNEIIHNKEWVKYAYSQLKSTQEQLKITMIEYEKFKYLELEETKKILKQKQLIEAKELDEIALMTYKKNN